MQIQPAKPAPKRQTLPCPNPRCERGSVEYRSSGPYAHDAVEPRYYSGACETCSGEGVLDSWTCGCCTRDFDSGDELPGRTDGDSFTCAACVREEAIDSVNVADLVRAVDELHDAVMDGEVGAMDLPPRLAALSGRLDELAKALGHEETKR